MTPSGGSDGDQYRKAESHCCAGQRGTRLAARARAQQPAKLPTIGFLGAGSPTSWRSWTNAFVRRLGELGWIEGHTVAIEYRWAEGRNERFAEFAAEFVKLKVDVIVTAGIAGVAAKQATSTIPIVLGVASDPIGDGLVTAWRDRAATLPDCRSSRPISPAATRTFA